MFEPLERESLGTERGEDLRHSRRLSTALSMPLFPIAPRREQGTRPRVVHTLRAPAIPQPNDNERPGVIGPLSRACSRRDNAELRRRLFPERRNSSNRRSDIEKSTGILAHVCTTCPLLRRLVTKVVSR